MAKFYIKEGVGSLSLDGTIYNEGELVEMTAKQAKTLGHLVTKNKPTEEVAEEITDTPEEIVNDIADEIEDVIEDTPEEVENTDSEEVTDTEDSEDTEEVDLETMDLDNMKALATAEGVKFVGNIGAETLRTRLKEHFTK